MSRPYDALTEHERKVVDSAYRELSRELNMHSVYIANDDRAERVVDAIAAGIIASRKTIAAYQHFRNQRQQHNE